MLIKLSILYLIKLENNDSDDYGEEKYGNQV